MRAVHEQYAAGAVVASASYFREELEYSGPDWLNAPEDFQDRMAGMTAADAMVRGVISVGPDATVADVAHRMRQQRIHRVFVVEDGQLVGIVTTFDLVGLLEHTSRDRSAQERPGR